MNFRASTTHTPLGYAVENRGKYSVAVGATDRRLLLELAAGAQGLFDGLGYRGIEMLGISPQSMFEHNPELRILRISPFGQTGPPAPRRGEHSHLLREILRIYP